MSRFIEIADPNEVIDYRYVDPSTKQETGTIFQLQVLTIDERSAIERKHTKPEWVRGQRVMNFDADAYVSDCLDKAIKGWNDPVSGECTVRSKGRPVPCTTKAKSMLPESVRAELVRLCVGRELADIMAQQRGEAVGDAPADPTKGFGTSSASSLTARPGAAD